MRQPPLSHPVNHETRLALVLNGGVSLAVWMGGVTHELDLLRHASGDAGEDTVEPEDQEVFNIWKEITKSQGTRVVIDVVAGSSAGGLNGMLLATALGRGAALPNLRKVWEESAALNKLLVPKSKTSVLSGEAFETKIRAAVEEIGVGTESARIPITLFLPATSLDGRARSYVDGFGNQFAVRDHRRLYRFQNDDKAVIYTRTDQTWGFKPNEQADFIPKNKDALVQAARATGSFPVAFPPVSESPLMAFRVHPKPALDDPASFVMDGGVLNNAPFAPVLEAIGRRTLENPGMRVLVYVVPSSGRGEHESKEQIDENTSSHRIAFNATRYPQEADFRSSTEDLCNRLSSSVRDARLDLFQRVSEGDLDANLTRLTGLAKGLLEEYRRNRARAVIYDLRRRLADDKTVTSLAVTPETPAEKIDQIIDAEDPPNWVPLKDPGGISDPLKEEWRWGLIVAERVLQSLSSHLHGCLRGVAKTKKAAKLNKAQQECLIDGVQFIAEQQKRVVAVVEAFDAQTRLQSDSTTVLSDEGAASLITMEFERLEIPETLRRIVAQSGERYVKALRAANVKGWNRPEDAVSACLAVEVLTSAYAAPSKVIEPLMPEFQFLRLGPDKMSRVLFEDRFSDMGDRKLYGVRFQHFAAFFNSDWRKSDFAWGRLDAAHHLLRLFTFTTEQERRDREYELHWAILKAEAPEGEGDPHKWMMGNLEELNEPTDNKLLEKATRSKGGKKAFADIVDSILEVFRLNRFPFRGIIRFFRPRILKAYVSDSKLSPIGAVRVAIKDAFSTGVMITLLLAYVFLMVWTVTH
ncbi:DUF3376 domain-containing protein [Streptomyces nojiriensis]|uniref:DUF3376 domain-containing protein n=1 Tax=Streptomyces nojiriensis TaxID=66374 RepID=UPI003661BE8F